MQKFILTLFFILSALSSSLLLGADSIPVSRINITDAAETKIVGPLQTDINGVHRAPVDILGESTVTPGEIDEIFKLNAENGGSSDLIVDGSTVAVTFTVTSHPTKKTRVNSIRFYGGCVNLKFDQFFCKSMDLSTGIEVTIKARDKTLVLALLKSTEDFKNVFSICPSTICFKLNLDAPGGDQFLFIATFDPPITLEPDGTFGTDDSIKIKIQDDLTGAAGGNLKQFEFLATGFLE